MEIEFEHTLYPTSALVNVCPLCGKRILGPSRITPESAVPAEIKSEPATGKRPRVSSPLWNRVKALASGVKNKAENRLEEKAQETLKISGSDRLVKSYERLHRKTDKKVPEKDSSLPVGKVVIDDMIFDPEACELFFTKDMPVFGNRVLKTYYYKTRIGSFVKITKDPERKDYTFTKISEKEVKNLLARDVELYERILGTKLGVYGTVPEEAPVPQKKTWREETELVPDNADETPVRYTEPSSEECQPSPLPETTAEAGGEHAFDLFDEQYDPFGDSGDEYEPLESAIF